MERHQPRYLPVDSTDVPSPIQPPPWRVCSTRDEPDGGPLAEALRAHGFIAVAVPVLVEAPPEDRGPLDTAAARLDEYDWLVCASVRSVRALKQARRSPWPRGLRTAAVGGATAQALLDAGADPQPLVADEGGADALWPVLREADHWPGRRVLLPTTPGGRRVLIDRLREADARVDEVEAYRMCRRSFDDLAGAWHEAAPNAAVLASPAAAETLIEAVGTPALNDLRAVVAIGPTTADTLARHGVRCLVAAQTDFAEVARTLAAHRAIEAAP
jgi:uroporphyrinogen-III synthase